MGTTTPKSAAWQDTCTTLHLWTQIIGKVRLALAPRVNHWRHIALYVTPRGFTTSAIPVGERSLQIDFDFIAHRLLLACSDGGTSTLPLSARSVAGFYREVLEALRSLGIRVEVSSAGFWPGAGLGEPAFYSYAYPEPPGFAEYPVKPEKAYYHPDMREFVLPYEAVRTAGEPDRALLAFLQSSYDAAAEKGRWDRSALERPPL